MNRILVSLALVAVLVAVGSGSAVARDPILVDTFDEEFINWATPHVQDFTFPAQQLYTQVVCHMTIGCPRTPGDCDPWDRLGNLRVRVADSDTTFIDYEITRFITPYDITFAGGPQTCSWTTDVTDYQFLLHDDVTLVLYVESWMGDNRGWLLTVTFEMVPGVPEREPFAIERLWRPGSVRYGDPDYPYTNDLPPVEVTIPEAATWASFRAYSTGHSFWNTDNAAEFSNKWQRVVVGGQSQQHNLWRPDCENNRCSPQSGTWQYDRAGWCPGDKADPWVVDITDWVTPGETAQFAFELQPYENWCRPNNPECVDATGCTCDGHAYYEFEGQVVYFRPPNPTAAGDGRLVPGTLHLVGNHPNPFNPSTTISYHLAAPGEVSIAVYDAEGARVRQVRLAHEAGTHAWTWNGRDAGGRLLPAGVYLYEVRTGGERVTAKMLMLK